MKRWRAHLYRLVPLAVLLFTAGVAVPRQGLVFHQHEGGDHFHVHGDELTGDEHDDHHAHESLHHAHGATLDHDDIGFEEPDPVHLGHWHTQPPFQRVVAATVAMGVRVVTIAAVTADVPEDVDPRSLLPDRARGPPGTAVS